MRVTPHLFKLTPRDSMITIVTMVLGLAFVWVMYNRVQSENHRNALQIGNSIAAALPVEKISHLTASLSDTSNQDYKALKNALHNIVIQNSNTRFAYLYAQKGNTYYFLVDSEPSGSADYSPPGQQFTEISEPDKKPFATGFSLVTTPSTDRWGTWVSVLVPVKESGTGRVLAVFGMDINATSWKMAILEEVAESSILVVAVVLLGFITMRYLSKNKHLRGEIAKRSGIEKALAESEERYRLLYENASIGIYQTTPEGKVLLSNNALLKILGYQSFDELKERDIEKGEFDPTYPRSQFKEKIEKDGEIQGLESAWRRQDGQLVHIRENAKVIRDQNGKVLYYDGTIEDITDRKLAEKALQYSEQRFRQIAEQSREVVWEVDANGLYTYVSPLSLNVWGYAPSELVGIKYFYDLHPDATREDYRKMALTMIAGRQSFHDYINQVVKATGETIWVITNAVPIIDEDGSLAGYRGADSDITERIEREQQLKKLTLAVEQSPVSIVITNVAGIIEYVNPKVCEITGYSSDELIGQNPRIFKSGFRLTSFYANLWETIISGKVWHGEFLNRRKNGELYWEAASITPIFDDEANIINFLSVKEDITNLKELISELKEAKEKAESSDLLKSAFIQSISHEIRTPLNGIVGMSEQLIGSSFPEQKKEMLKELIKESSSRLINTVNNYLDISMIVSGNVGVNVQKFDLNDLLTTLKNRIQPDCDAKNLDLKLYLVAGNSQFIVNSDAELIQKILMHLLANAIKFTEKGNISFGYERKPDTIEFFVKDTGIGIAHSFLPHAFEAFTQADSSDSRAYEGSGLGLAIAYRLTTLLSGTIDIESEPGKGSTFVVIFPKVNFSENQWVDIQFEN